MAKYKCKLYKKTGFKSNEIPYNETVLEASASGTFTTDTLNITEAIGLPEIRVAGKWADFKDVDFAKVWKGEEVYFAHVYNPHMISGEDTCVLPLDMCGILTLGGIGDKDVKIIGGITERVHVGDDSKFYACEGDPLLNPIQPLEIVEEWVTAEEGKGSANKLVFIECRVDPVNTLKSKEAVEVFYKDIDPDTQQEVTKSAGGYPAVKHPDQPTYFGVDNYNAHDNPETAGTTLYIANGTYSITPLVAQDLFTNEAVDNIQALGISQGAIINQYEIPKGLFGALEAKTPNEDTTIQSQITYIGRKFGFLSLTDIPGAINKNNKNNLVSYSPVQKFGMITAAGNSAEYNLEDLRNGDSVSYDIAILSDPRPDGKPYYRPRYVNGVQAGGDRFKNFWRNAIAGMGWKKVPLVYKGASGSALNTQKFENSQAIEAINRKQEINNQQWGLINTAFKGIGSAAKSIATGNFLSGAAGIFGQSLSAVQQIENNRYTQQGYTAEKIRDVYDLYAANNIVAPTVNFPYEAEAIRDTMGNGVLCYQYRYSDDDRKRIDRLLTMYGYRIHKPLEKSDFNNRKYFNYVACNNAEIVGGPAWICAKAEEELSNGVRVWHTKPNPSCYADNPIK